MALSDETPSQYVQGVAAAAEFVRINVNNGDQVSKQIRAAFGLPTGESRLRNLPTPRTREQHDEQLGIDGHTHQFTVPLRMRMGCSYPNCNYTKSDVNNMIRNETSIEDA